LIKKNSYLEVHFASLRHTLKKQAPDESYGVKNTVLKLFLNLNNRIL